MSSSLHASNVLAAPSTTSSPASAFRRISGSTINGSGESGTNNLTMNVSTSRDGGATVSLLPIELLSAADEDYSYFLFPPEHPIRVALCSLRCDEKYYWAVLVCVVIHIILLALLQPEVASLSPSSSVAAGVLIVECIVSVLLWLDVVIGSVAYGLCLHPHSYLRRNQWNVLDFLVSLLSLLQLIPQLQASPWVRVLHIFRVLRYPQNVSYLQRMIRCCWKAAPMLIANFVLLVYVMAVFGTVSVKAWQGDLDKKCFALVPLETSALSPLLVFQSQDWPCGFGNVCPSTVPAAMFNANVPAVSPNNSYSSIFNVTCDTHLDQYRRSNMNFNNIGTVLLLLMRVVSLDNIRQTIIDVMSMSGPQFSVFIVGLVILTSYLSIYLFLAILVDAFEMDRRGTYAPESSQSAMVSTRSGSENYTFDVGLQVCLDDEDHVDSASEQRLKPPLVHHYHNNNNNNNQLQPHMTPLADDSLLSKGQLRNSANGTTTGRTPDQFDSVMNPDQTMVHLPTPSETGVEPRVLTELPAWNRRFPLPFLESVRKRGLWSTIVELECTTSHPVIEGTVHVRFAMFLTSRWYVVSCAVISVVNLAALCVLHYGLEEATQSALVATTLAMMWLLLPSVVLKFVVFGWKATLSDAWNTVDLIAVSVAVLETLVPSLFASYSLLRGLRTTRVLRIGKYFTPLERLTRSVFHSWIQVLRLVTFLVLFLLFFAIIGMVLFGDSYSGSSLLVSDTTAVYRNSLAVIQMRRDSFGTLWESMLMCFMVLSADGWTVRLQFAFTQSTPKNIAAFVFFTTLFVASNFILINVLVVLLTESTAQTLEEEDAELEVELPPLLLLPVFKAKQLGDARKGDNNSLLTALSEDVRPQEHREFVDVIEDATEKQFALRFLSWLFHVEKFKTIEKSFFFFSLNNDIRYLCLVTLGSNIYRVVIALAVLANVVFLFFESPLNTAQLSRVLSIANLVFLFIFCTEMIMKMIAFGVVLPAPDLDPASIRPHVPAYFRDWWNVVDFVVNLLCIVAQGYPPFRAAVALRTLRLISFTTYTRTIMGAMMESLPQVLNAFAVAFYFFLIFGILGVQLFGGRFQRCSDPTITRMSDCVGNFSVAATPHTFVVANRSWDRSSFHFDALPNALMSLFVIAIGGSWTSIMYDGMDVGEPGESLRQNQYPLYALYFIAAFVIINIFSLKFTIAVLINFFARTKKRREGSLLLTDDQQQYVKARDTIEAVLFRGESESIPRNTELCKALHKLFSYTPQHFNAPLVDYVLYLVVVINSIVIFSNHRDELAFEPYLRQAVDVVCLLIYAVECAVRIVTYGPQRHFSSLWSVIELLILAAIVIGLVFPDPPLSFFSAAVLIKLIKKTPLNDLLHSIAKNFLQYLNVIVLLFFVFFVYAVAGVIIFGNVAEDGVGLHAMSNFRDVPSALLVLFESATGRGWEVVMNSLSGSVSGCVNEGTDNLCGSQAKAVAFFVTFLIIAVFAVLHLLVAVVVEIFSTSLDKTDPSVSAFFELRHLWIAYFGYGQSQVHIDEFLAFIPEIPRELTGLAFGRRAMFMKLIASLQIPIDSRHRILYKDIMRAFVWRRFKVETRSAFHIFHEALTKSEQRSAAFTVAHALAARIIQRMYREFKRKEKEAFRNRMLAIKRHLLKQRGSSSANVAPQQPEDHESSLLESGHGTSAEDELGFLSRRRLSAAKNQRFSQDIKDLFQSLSISGEHPAELKLQGKSNAIPKGGIHIPDAGGIFAFGRIEAVDKANVSFFSM